MVIQILLIQSNGFCQIRKRKTTGDRKSVFGQDIQDTFCTAGFCQSFCFGEKRDLIHADSDSLAVAFSFIMIVLLNGVGQSMSEIEQHALAFVKLVVFYDFPLDIHTACDDISKLCFQIVIRGKGLQFFEKRSILDTSVFDNFAHTVFQKMIGQTV